MAFESIYPVLRAIAHLFRIRPEHHPALMALVGAMRDRFELPESVDRDYAFIEDPWRYTTNPIERERHALAVDLLDRVREGKRFPRAPEIACAEGVFTEMLAVRCESLLAVDFSEARYERRTPAQPQVSSD